MSVKFNFNEKESIGEKLRSWWSYTLTYRIEIPYRDFIAAIKNIFKWRKIVAKDRDWDYHFIVEVLRFKLDNTKKYIEKTQRHLDYKQDIKYLQLCVNLIDRIWGEENNYDTEYLQYQNSEIFFEPAKKIENEEEVDYLDDDGEPLYTMNENVFDTNYDEYFYKNALTYKKAIQYLQKNSNIYVDITDNSTIARTISTLKHEKAKKLLFKILAEKIESFWD